MAVNITETGEGMRIVTLDRAEKANALTEAMLGELIAAVAHSTAPVLILTGVGQVFSAGADLDEVRGGTLATSPLWEELSGAIAGYDGLTIAALNGTAAGGALGMVLACDLRVAVAGAKLFYPVIRVGVMPQPSDPARLAALVGPARAKRILLTGAKIDAATAEAWGAFDAVVEEGAALETAQAWAGPAIAAKPGLVGRIKGLI
ncbi:MAG: enoyl-CoA hydratase/isomerase family protein [Pseudomonadota bacterium]